MKDNYLFWLIGKKVYEAQDKKNNYHKYFSDYYSYFYGNSLKFNRENINFMERFYLYFPIYLKRFEELSLNHFKVLVSIKKPTKRYFYFWIIYFCKSSVEELNELINSNCYERI